MQILENGWINVRWEWRGFSPGSASRVHESWIRDNHELRQRQDTDYCFDDNISINWFSIASDGLFVRVPFNNAPNLEL